MTKLETDSLLLKTLYKDSASMVLDFYKDNKEIFEPWEPEQQNNFYTLAYQSFLSAEYHLMLEGKLLRYWVFLKDNPDQIIGSVCFQNFLMGPYRNCSLGYKFDYRYHHQGYAYKSVRKGIEYMFEQRHMHRIEAYIMPNNLPSIRLIERLHFHFEGLSISYAKIAGKWTNHNCYALINPKEIL